MSHIVSIKTQVRDIEAIRLACQWLSLREPVYGVRRLFSNAATGWVVQLPAWRYTVVRNTDASTLHFDNYEGRWGAQQELDRLLQADAVEKSTRPQCPP